MKYDVVLFGATTLACAWAEKCAEKGQKVAVVEEMGLVGYDYSEAWKTATVPETACPEAAKTLYAELETRDAVRADGVLYMPAFAPVLCNRMKESGADCFFYTRVKKIERGAKGFCLTASSLGGDFTFEGAARSDDNSQFGRHGTWQTSAGWEFIEGYRFIASYGTSYKAPNLGQLYGFYGNPNLDPIQLSSGLQSSISFNSMIYSRLDKHVLSC